MITHLFHNFHIGSFFSYMTPLQFCKRRPQLLAMEITTELISLGGGGLIKRIREAGGGKFADLTNNSGASQLFCCLQSRHSVHVRPKRRPKYTVRYHVWVIVYPQHKSIDRSHFWGVFSFRINPYLLVHIEENVTTLLSFVPDTML